MSRLEKFIDAALLWAVILALLAFAAVVGHYHAAGIR